MSLSDNIRSAHSIVNYKTNVIWDKNVKDFISQIKDSIRVLACLNPDVEFCGECDLCKAIVRTIDEEAGDKLI